MKNIFQIPEKYNNLLDGPFFAGPNIDKKSASSDPDAFTFFSHYTHFRYECERYDDVEFIFKGCRDILNVAEYDCTMKMMNAADKWHRLYVSNECQLLPIKNSQSLNIYCIYVMDCGYLEICAESCSVKIGSTLTEVG